MSLIKLFPDELRSLWPAARHAGCRRGWLAAPRLRKWLMDVMNALNRRRSVRDFTSPLRSRHFYG
jgi:hypothetical protein